MIASILASRLLPYGIAILAAFALVWAIYAKGAADARHKIELDLLRKEKAAVEEQLRVWKANAEEDQKQATDDAAKIAELEAKQKELLDALDHPDDICLTDTDTDGLLKLWPGGR